MSETVEVKKTKKPMSKQAKRGWIVIGILSVLAIGVWIIERYVLGHSKSLSQMGDSMFPETAFEVELFGNVYAISQSVVSAIITSGVLITAAALFRIFIFPRFKTVPSGLQSFVEWIVNMFDGMSKDKVGHYHKPLGPIVFTFAAFICVGTLLELLGIRPTSADINACAAMALSTFILINFYGFKEKGVGKRLMRYITIIPIFTDLAVPVSMTFRLFGSILSGYMIMGMIYIAMPAVLPGFLAIMFTLFHAFIQSYIFAVLSLTFIGEAVE